MPSAADIQNGLTGAWRLMMGRSDGLRLFDLSVDGFWDSFFAIVVALPALAIGWISLSNQALDGAETFSRGGLILRYALIDGSTWLLPLIGFAMVAKPIGIADRFVSYVVASNWGSALLAWMTLPPVIATLFAPDASSLVDLFRLLFFGASLVLGWRLTTVVIGRGAAFGTAVFAGMFAASLTVLLVLQALLGMPLS